MDSLKVTGISTSLGLVYWTDLLSGVLMCIMFSTSVVGAFAIISTMTPNPKDDKIVSQLYSLINFLGANFGKSKNND